MELKSQDIRHNWKQEEALSLYHLPFPKLIYKALNLHSKYFPDNEVQVSTLLSIKTGGCAEDCKYCPQSAHYKTEVKASKLMDVDDVITQARNAKANGASRFCMGAAWREPKNKDMESLTQMVSGVKELGLETCMTLGMLTDLQAKSLKEAGLDYYNHNIDTSESYYDEIITTRTFQDRILTLQRVREAGIKVCCGGIVGMGEDIEDRISMLITLANLPKHPESVPINLLVQVEGTPLENINRVEILDFVRTIALTRILMPASYVRLSAGREGLGEEAQALCFLAGANSIFYGEKLLTTSNPTINNDKLLLDKLGLKAA